MLRLRILTAALILTAISVSATDLTSIDADVENLRYHLRLSPGRSADIAATLYWNYCDSNNYRALEYTIPAITTDDPLTGFTAPWRVIEHSACRDSILVSGLVTSTYNSGAQQGFSAILSVTSTSASISLGGAKISTIIPIDFRREAPDSIGYHSSRPLKELRNDIRLLPRIAPGVTAAESADNLLQHLATTTDRAEGLWMYLDRDTEPAMAALGGKYSLATLKEPDGSYSILYLSGANAAPEQWHCLRVKGRLYPTIFTDHFDLIWVEPSGHLLSDELSANLELEGNILTLHFPLHRSKVRFRRVPRENILKIP